ncbi:MAG: glycosyltransferase family 1 protein [Betaproteobacteria bacterium]|nr:glycosyltransferase family 1 protein [Betaproteobacteria bacterium]
MFIPSARYPARPPGHYALIEYGPNASSDYYLIPRLRGLPLSRLDSREAPRDDILPEGTFVIIVRYLPRAWGEYLSRQAERLAGVAYFVDDDLPAGLASAGLPWRYRFKLYRLFHRRRALLARLCSELWVASPALREKYARAAPKLVEPLPLAEPSASGVTYFYHGSASHRSEWRWLREVVAPLQLGHAPLSFTAIGDRRVQRQFRDLPRVLVLHPMSWISYRDSLPAMRHDIGLAPLLPGAFNAARAATKHFDITRLGAAGIYSRCAPYSGYVRDGENGLLLDNDPAAWRAAILRLAAAPDLRASLLARAREELAARARVIAA